MLFSLILSLINGFHQAGGFIQNVTFQDRMVSLSLISVIYFLMHLVCLGIVSPKDRKFYFTLGGITYPLYLLHNVIGKAVIDYFSAYISEEVLIFVVIGIVLLLAYLVFRFFEQPIAPRLKRKLEQLITSR